MAADYFPLKENTRFEYKYKSTEFEGTARIFIDLVKVSEKPGRTVAQAQMTFELRDSHTSEYTITKDPRWLTTANGVMVGGRREYPIPPAEGRKWEESPDTNEIVSMSDKISIAAGKFSKCLKVVTLLDGGSAGKAVRYYAPGVGCVLEEYNDNSKTCELELISVGRIPPSPTKKKR